MLHLFFNYWLSIEYLLLFKVFGIKTANIRGKLSPCCFHLPGGPGVYPEIAHSCFWAASFNALLICF